MVVAKCCRLRVVLHQVSFGPSTVIDIVHPRHSWRVDDWPSIGRVIFPLSRHDGGCTIAFIKVVEVDNYFYRFRTMPLWRMHE